MIKWFKNKKIKSTKILAVKTFEKMNQILGMDKDKYNYENFIYQSNKVSNFKDYMYYMFFDIAYIMTKMIEDKKFNDISQYISDDPINNYVLKVTFYGVEMKYNGNLYYGTENIRLKFCDKYYEEFLEYSSYVCQQLAELATLVNKEKSQDNKKEADVKFLRSIKKHFGVE